MRIIVINFAGLTFQADYRELQPFRTLLAIGINACHKEAVIIAWMTLFNIISNVKLRTWQLFHVLFINRDYLK